MCLGIPGKIIKIYNNYADVDFGGVIKKINASMVENLKIGDYVIVHAGFAIGILSTKDTNEIISLLLKNRSNDENFRNNKRDKGIGKRI